MAKRVMLIDDITGDPIDEELGGGTVRFAIEGKAYSIDLGVKNKEAFFKDFDKWVEHATEEGRADTAAPRQRRASTGSGRSKEELAAAREWLKKNGHEVSDRGRIKAELLAIFDEAHSG